MVYQKCPTVVDKNIVESSVYSDYDIIMFVISTFGLLSCLLLAPSPLILLWPDLIH
jgi:hypothetical protein